MQNKEIEILSHKISDIQISIDDDVKEKFEMQIDSRSKIREPINDNDTTLLLNLELNINSKDEMLNISIISDVIFDLHACNKHCPFSKSRKRFWLFSSSLSIPKNSKVCFISFISVLLKANFKPILFFRLSFDTSPEDCVTK